MNELVRIKQGDVLTDSLIIAEGTENEHTSIKKTIDVYKQQIQELGALSISNRKSTGGRPEKYYLLNEPQATFLITLLRNTPVVVAFKLELVKQFYQMRQLLQERSTPDFLELREQGKTIRRIETDAIKEFVEYATVNGSSHADWYYKAFTSMVNKAVGAADRGSIGRKEEYDIQTAERVIAKLIHKGIKEHIPYKRLYRDCRNAIETVF